MDKQAYMFELIQEWEGSLNKKINFYYWIEKWKTSKLEATRNGEVPGRSTKSSSYPKITKGML